MAKFCSVAPYPLLKKILETSPSKRALLLAHDVVERPREYMELLMGRWQVPSDLIIMDNSAYELKAAVDSKMVWEAVGLTRPNYVVLPDIYLDARATYDATSSVVEDWHYLARDLPYRVDMMALPQGKNLQEWVDCAEKLAKLPHIAAWGIPRNFREVLGFSRISAIRICRMLDPYKYIHLFGFSDDYVDDLQSSMYAQSIDSTTPIRAATLGKEFSLTMEMPKRGYWWNNMNLGTHQHTTEEDALMLSNVDYATKLLDFPYGVGKGL